MTDTPRGLKPHGFSGNAQPYGSHWLLKTAPPAQLDNRLHHRASLTSEATRLVAERTSSKMRYCFYPWNGLPRNRPHEY